MVKLLDYGQGFKGSKFHFGHLTIVTYMIKNSHDDILNNNNKHS
jgi:hypothetical protein